MFRGPATSSEASSDTGYTERWADLRLRVDGLHGLLADIQIPDRLSESTEDGLESDLSGESSVTWDDTDSDDSKYMDQDHREILHLKLVVSKLLVLETTAKKIREDLESRLFELNNPESCYSISSDRSSDDDNWNPEGDEAAPLATLHDFSRLPPELIVHIIEFALHEDSEIVFRLSHANRELRQLTLETPSLWTNVDIFKGRQEVDAYLKRSDIAPLKVHLTMLLDVSSDNSVEDLQEALSRLHPHSQRIRTIHAVYIYNSWLDILYRFLERTPLPMLRALEVGIWNIVPSTSETVPNAAPPSGEHAAWELTNVCLWNLTSIRHPALLSPQTKSLQISSHGSLSFDHFVEVLRGMPLLENLIVMDTKFISTTEHNSYSLQKVPTCHLLNAEFVRIVPAYVGRLGASLDFAGVESLNITFASPFIRKSENAVDEYTHVLTPDVYPAEFALQSILSGTQTLRKLDLGECCLPVSTLRHLFHTLDSLRSLRLVYHGHGDVLSWLGHPDPDDDGGLNQHLPCRNLERLLIENHNVSGATLVQIFRSRLGTTRPLRSLTLQESDGTKFTRWDLTVLRELVEHVEFNAYHDE